MRAAVLAFHASTREAPSAPSVTVSGDAGWRHVREVPEADLLSDAVCARPRPAHVDEGPGHLFCSSSEHLDVDSLIQHLQQLSAKNKDCVRYVHVVTPRLKRVMATKHMLQSKVQHMLQTMGVSPDTLYLHQACAVDAALEGRNVIVTTATASGKSLCFNLPVMNAVLNPNGDGIDSTTAARALYIYPTKSLTQDQLRAIHKMSDAWLSKAKVAVLDGDTPMHQRRDILQGASIILTNPDMLHVSILPQHASMSTLLAALKFVVIDEAHMYHGAFGVHVAMVLRRLRRLCAHYGATPQFLCASATIASPASHLSQLTGVEEASFLVVSEDGSPSGEKRFVLWNPPPRISSTLVQQDLEARAAALGLVVSRPPAGGNEEAVSGDSSAAGGQGETGPGGLAAGPAAARGNGGVGRSRRRASKGAGESQVGAAEASSMWELVQQQDDEPRRLSSIAEVAHLFAELVRHGMRTIAFCTTRKLSELVLQYAQDALRASGHHSLCDLIMSYRGGYTPEQRRQIERRLFSDQLRGVAATNALELGVDVGSMDATLHLGFQRSISSLWQQAGRAGRRNHKSLSIYVAWDSPIDQFFLRHPQQLFHMPLEPTVLNLGNADVVAPHLLCAASELSLSSVDADMFATPPLSLPHDLCAAGAAGAATAVAAAAGASDSPEDPSHEVFENLVQHLREKGHSSLGCLDLAVGGERGSSGRQWAFIGGPKPQRGVSLRCIDDKRWSLQVATVLGEYKVVEEVEEWMAFYQIYEGATYMNNGRTYIIHTLDFDNRAAFARGPVHVDYYTSGLSKF
eukprot:Tamp_06524.p1 GENE.Tamp_06524~~Tamp_06524.p1  ORF type:complete len:853 (+),score=200.48 Tamp_06524:163-2559(+)